MKRIGNLIFTETYDFSDIPDEILIPIWQNSIGQALKRAKELADQEKKEEAEHGECLDNRQT